MLTEAQIKARKGRLTASRVSALMTGDAAKILALYQEMIGEAEPEDLSDVWPVRLGEATELLNLEWFERKNFQVTRKGEVVLHPKYEWAAATLDGWCEELQCPIECKHVGGREPLETIIQRYWPQLGWQMFVTGARQCALSVIFAANEPIVEFIESDANYQAVMLARGEQFMDFVRRREPPVVLDPVPAPVDASKVYDFTGNNAWASHADEWLANRQAAEVCKMAEKSLKAIVPDDARKCHGHSIQITRDRAGRLSLREATQ